MRSLLRTENVVKFTTLIEVVSPQKNVVKLTTLICERLHT